MNIFDILGPVMVGPSSSHTAGAVRIGLITRKLLGNIKLVNAAIYLHGSFAATGVGHGTDKALIAGLLGMDTDDIRIPNSFEVAKKEGLNFTIDTINIKDAHPNSALLSVESERGEKVEVQASSLGGGRIMVNRIDGVEVNFTGESPTLIINNLDRPGYVAEVTKILYDEKINIGTMQLFRDKRGGAAVMIIETDSEVSRHSIEQVEHLDGVLKVTYLGA